MADLNPRQRAFINAYVGEANGNGTKAAITAGYSEATACQIASQLLRRTDVREAVSARLDKHDLRTDAILRRLGKLAHSEPEKPPTAQDIISASKVILQVNGALQAKQQQSTGITVNIGFLSPASQPTVEVLTIESSPVTRTESSPQPHVAVSD